MKFDNNKALYSVMRAELLTTLIYAGLFMISFIDVYQNKYIKLENYEYAGLITLFFGAVALFWYGLNYSYFAFDNTGNHIIIKYFRITPKLFKTKPKMVKIPKASYVKYEIRTSIFGLKRALYLYQNTKNGEVEYPPIYISALNKQEIKQLKQLLQL